MRLYRSYGWALGIAGICYNVSHWILAVQYWTLSTKLEAMLNGTSMKTFKTQTRCIFVIGLLLNVSTGVTIVVNVYKRNHHPNIFKWRDWLNFAAAAVSNLLLIDALRRLRKIIKGDFAVDTWQMILHVSAYLLVLVSGSILIFTEFTVDLAYNSKRFYKLYLVFILCVFFS